MVGEFVFVSDISSICHWANTLLIAVVFIPFLLSALINKLTPWRRNGLSKAEWRSDYFERGSLTPNKLKYDLEEQDNLEAGETEVLLPGLTSGEQANMDNKGT